MWPVNEAGADGTVPAVNNIHMRCEGIQYLVQAPVICAMRHVCRGSTPCVYPPAYPVCCHPHQTGLHLASM